MAILVGGLLFTSCTKKQQYTITVAANPMDGGIVTGGGSFKDQDSTTLIATPNDGYEFIKWQDGSKDNPHTIIVTRDATWTAYFEKIFDETGVNVTFNGEQWNAKAVQGLFNNADDLWSVYAMRYDGSLPIVDFASSIKTGANSVTCAEDGTLGSNQINWVEYYDYTFLRDTTSDKVHGDYWAKQATITVSEFDPTELKLSTMLTATMFNAYDVFIDTFEIDEARTAEMFVSINQLQLVEADSSMSSKKIAGKLIPGKPGQVPFAAFKPRRK